MSDPDFWNDIERAQKVGQKNKELQGVIDEYKSIEEQSEEIEVFITVALEDKDTSLLEDIKTGIDELKDKVEDLSLQTLLKGDYDHSNAILSFHPGAGGTEAQDWVEMLLRMYIRWAEKKGHNVETLDYLAGDEAGVKSATILIEGANAYGFLKSEKNPI